MYGGDFLVLESDCSKLSKTPKGQFTAAVGGLRTGFAAGQG